MPETAYGCHECPSIISIVRVHLEGVKREARRMRGRAPRGVGMDQNTSTYDAADANGATPAPARLKKAWSDPRLDEVLVAELTRLNSAGCNSDASLFGVCSG